jgi:hypothetical protein
MTSLSPKGIISFTLTWGVLGPLALSVTKVQHLEPPVVAFCGLLWDNMVSGGF